VVQLAHKNVPRIFLVDKLQSMHWGTPTLIHMSAFWVLQHSCASTPIAAWLPWRHSGDVNIAMIAVVAPPTQLPRQVGTLDKGVKDAFMVYRQMPGCLLFFLDSTYVCT
jgi:hypothetical protein